MDRELRRQLYNTTQAIRRLLEKEFQQQLEGLFDIRIDGRIAEQPGAHLDPAQRFVRTRLVAAINHECARVRQVSDTAASSPEAAAVEAFLREAAFTCFNRFSALKVLEARQLVQECVSRGVQSSGFREFTGLAPGLSVLPDGGYRLYLECLFDEIAGEVGVLFDRRTPASLLWPRRAALLELLEHLNKPELASAWASDETIGWLYQYFNSDEEREAMRRASPSNPRNTHELAVRNQFFTPRYVVEFLTDNALGRLWIEMTGGRTSLRERCRYFIRPTEGDPTPERALKDPRKIRVLDPACGSMHFGLYVFDLFEAIYAECWDIARGESPHSTLPESFAPFVSFCADFATKEDFRRQVPRLILEHNIHGVDIDPRAVQIAGFALWLRAQRAWNEQKLRVADRPRLRRVNLVCAEPMPGEADLLRQFVDEQFAGDPARDAYRHFLERIFEHMKLAGEAGSLLKIEDDISGIVEETKRRWTQRRPIQLSMGDIAGPKSATQEELAIDLSGADEAEFWERAESRLYEALADYAKHAEEVTGENRRLFAEDARQGFAFIDLCRQRYDVALMNPPFGDASLPSKPYIDATYGDTRGDVYKAFVECFADRLTPGGLLGIISSRTGFFLSQSEDWRTRVVLRLYRPLALADLGSGVLDAMVEVAAYVLRSLNEHEQQQLTLSLVPTLREVATDRQGRFSLPKWQAARGGLKRHQALAELEHLEAAGFADRCEGEQIRFMAVDRAVRAAPAFESPHYPILSCVRVIGESDKGAALLDALRAGSDRRIYRVVPDEFSAVPGSPFSYWVSPKIRRLFKTLPPFEGNGRTARVGLQTSDDFRFLRLWWEVSAEKLCPPDVHPTEWNGPYCVICAKWFPILRGGRFSRYYSDITTVVNWAQDGVEIKAWASSLYNDSHWSRIIKNTGVYFRPGITWPLRGIQFSAQAVPSGSIFSVAGKIAIGRDRCDSALLLGLLNTDIADALIGISAGKVGGVQYEAGLIARIPVPLVTSERQERIGLLTSSGWAATRDIHTSRLTSHAFFLPGLLQTSGDSLDERSLAVEERRRAADCAVDKAYNEISELVMQIYQLDRREVAALFPDRDADVQEAEAVENDELDPAENAGVRSDACDLVDYAVGVAFGRWDIRFATGERPVQEPPAPFEPLPVCPPGMLQNEHGLPTSRSEWQRIHDAGEYPFDVAWDGIIVDDDGHGLDIAARIQAVLALIWPDSDESIEAELCQLLEASSLREWFRRSFFDHHLKRYSKSKRQAPIYWPLGTASGSYTVWLYYPRLSTDTLFRVKELVETKLAHEQRKAQSLTVDVGDTPNARQRKLIVEQEAFVAELIQLRDHVNSLAPLWHPDLDDGVIINAAPLWRLFPHRDWQRKCREVWEKLISGEYDWAKLAMHLWPERVVPKCTQDRSLAIAHGLESTFWTEDADTKWRIEEDPSTEIERLVAERTSTAAKSALASLSLAPAAAPRTRRRR